MRAILLLILAMLYTSGAQDHALGLTNAERKAMLAEHNKRRSEMKPPGKDILIMQWDFQLEELAQLHVSYCEYKEGGVDTATGQVIGLVEPGGGPAALMEQWFDEQASAYSKGDFADATDYIQIAWGATNRVGCAKASCGGLVNQTGTMEFWVCNYNQIGTLAQGSTPYTLGLSCSACPKTHGTCSENLCTPNSVDLGDYGAQVFPEGDEGFNKTEDSVPEKGYVIGGECPSGKNVYVTVNAGHFSNSRTVNAVVTIEIASQIYYSSKLTVIPNDVGKWNNEFPHLFTCVDYDTDMSISVYDCGANDTVACGGEWGVPETMLPLFFFPLKEWDNFEDKAEITLRGLNDPRYLVVSFYYAERGTTSTGVIIAAIVVILVIIIVAAGIVYWWQKKQNLAYHRANSNGVDRV